MWRINAHDHQLEPPGDWTTWLIIGGRGAGKTRAGAEWIRAQVAGQTAGQAGIIDERSEGQASHFDPPSPKTAIALVAETYADAREVMIEGPSGIRAVSYARSIPKPVLGSVLVALDGAPQTEGVDFSLDETTGIISFNTAPVMGVAITAGFLFDTPVRFDTDELRINLAAFKAGDIPSIALIEVLV